jgi:hypothetical protein
VCLHNLVELPTVKFHESIEQFSSLRLTWKAKRHDLQPLVATVPEKLKYVLTSSCYISVSYVPTSETTLRILTNKIHFKESAF